MSKQHVHQPLNQEVTAIGGHYVLVKEVRLPFQGRELLYLVGHAAFDSTCCGVGGCAYVLVPGFVLEWHAGANEQGLAVSRVEPVQDQALQKQIEEHLKRKEVVHQVRFL